MYKAIIEFLDASDDMAHYGEGEVYPRDGFNPSKERIEELCSDKNAAGRPLIRKVALSKKKGD